MKKAIKLLEKVNEHNFLDIYFVCSKPSNDIYAIESIAFLERDEAIKHCDYMNAFYNTTKYFVFRTCAHVSE